jgi:hypothetical protein
MRLLFLASALGVVLTAAASASEPPSARAAYVERRGLIEADARCGLFTADIRTALQVGAAQARGALLRAGWSAAQARDLEQTVVTAARARSCTDARTAAAAADARNAFAMWINAGSMEFTGWERTWLARRALAGDGWRLSQAIEAPVSAAFGVREQGGAQRFSLVIHLARGQSAPASAQLLMRDVERAPRFEIGLSQRVAYGIVAGAPAPGAAVSVASIRSIERIGGERSQAVFTFPDTAFADLLALDPRESVEIRLQNGRRMQSLYVEVGDVAAARAFLSIR